MRIPKKYFKLCMRYMFSHVGLFFVVCGYCVLGTLLFQAIEYDNEYTLASAAQQAAADIEEARRELTGLILNVTSFPEAGPDLIRSWLDQYQALIRQAITTYGSYYDGTYHEDINLGWAFPSGLLFTVSVVLAIGYGNVVPKTELGRFVLIVYALFGIPLTLMFLANIGKTFASVVRVMYARGCCYLCVKKRRFNRAKAKQLQEQRVDHKPIHYVTPVGQFRPRADTDNSQHSIIDDRKQSKHLVGVKIIHSEPEPTIFVPISLTLGILGLYIFLGTMLFSWWEGWSILISSYFNVVSLMTIGFGDFVPGWSTARTVMGKVKLVSGALYLLLGLAVISMGLNLIVEEIIEMTRKAGKKIGILDENHGNDGNKKRSNLEAAIRRNVVDDLKRR